ncbi:hypothetical protein HMPREF9946_02191 [Acetobacteraceae bacterium AT-5844]|nr:hypothetical protein HMPREF9946_02191 [Acetobacteraceae bacterium AT-5844]
MEQLGRFGHHPDPAIDFEVEAECLIGLTYDALHDMADRAEVRKRLSRAMTFKVGGVPSCCAAKARLRDCEAQLAA